MNWQDFLIAQAIQSVMGLIAVAQHNPQSATFQRFSKSLRTLRDLLNKIDLGDK